MSGTGSGREKIIERTVEYVKSELQGDSTGHDWWHILRVRNNAMRIASKESGADLFVVELAALLHDIADWKFHEGNEKASSDAARKWLEGQKVDDAKIKSVCEVIDSVTFKGAGVKTTPATIEGRIVQDADRLDAIGAIGIARAFAYGGKVGREIYNPDIKLEMHSSFEQYKNTKTGTTVNHFHEKLLLLKDRMNTASGKKMAEERHRYMEEFLERFHKEWDGNL